jgi:hypothetical protein
LIDIYSSPLTHSNKGFDEYLEKDHKLSESGMEMKLGTGKSTYQALFVVADIYQITL